MIAFRTPGTPARTCRGVYTRPLFLGAAGIAVVVAPAGQSLRHRVRSAFTDASGSFTVTGLAPGDYKAFAFEAIDLASMQAPEYRQPFESMGTSVTILSNGRETVDMKVISADQVAAAVNKLR